ncbi:MAG TPA: hypothetical protein VK623_01170 [Flavobacterium sp.]|nr:hypothetical protein [Flavobacterium sp.]
MKKSLLFFFLLASCAVFSQDPFVKPVTVQLKVPATAEQLIGKWAISKIRKGKTDIDPKLVSGSFFTFGGDQKYQTKVMGVDEAGDWQFGPENTSIFLIVKGQKSIWNVLKINGGELVMQKGIRGNIVTFSKNL